FFSSRGRHTRSKRDWSSDVCSSDLIVLWGASGSGKTFAAFDIAASIVRNVPWAGRRTSSCNVVYIAAEGALQSRAAAYLKHHERSEERRVGKEWRAGW